MGGSLADGDWNQLHQVTSTAAPNAPSDHAAGIIRMMARGRFCEIERRHRSCPFGDHLCSCGESRPSQVCFTQASSGGAGSAPGLSDLSAQGLGNRRGVALIPWGPRPSRGKVLEPSASRRCTQTWAMLIKRLYEIDPLACPECGLGRPDEGHRLHRAAAGRGDRDDPARAPERSDDRWPLARLTGTTGRRRWGPQPDGRLGPPHGPFRRAPGTDVRAHRHVRRDLLILLRRPSARGRYAPTAASTLDLRAKWPKRFLPRLPKRS